MLGKLRVQSVEIRYLLREREKNELPTCLLFLRCPVLSTHNTQTRTCFHRVLRAALGDHTLLALLVFS